MSRVFKMFCLQLGVLILVAFSSVGLADVESSLRKYVSSCIVEQDGEDTRLYISFVADQELVRVNLSYLGKYGEDILSVPIYASGDVGRIQPSQTLRVSSEFVDRVNLQFLFTNSSGVLDIEILPMNRLVPKNIASEAYRLTCSEA